MKQLADRLYNDVMVTGTAWWNLTTNALVEMLASKIVDPPAADLDETMRALGGIATAPWNRMTAAEFLKLNRHEGDD